MAAKRVSAKRAHILVLVAKLMSGAIDRETILAEHGPIMLRAVRKELQQRIVSLRRVISEIDNLQQLTPMQLAVYELLLDGTLTIPDIARKLNRSGHTVRNHVKEIYKIFGVHSRTELGPLGS